MMSPLDKTFLTAGAVVFVAWIALTIYEALVGHL